MSTYARPRLDPMPIRRWMRIRGISASELGEMCGMSKNHVQGLLLRKETVNGNRPGLSLDKAEDFAHALGFLPIELWGDDWIQAVLWEPSYSMTPKAIAARKWKAKRKAMSQV